MLIIHYLHFLLLTLKGLLLACVASVCYLIDKTACATYNNIIQGTFQCLHSSFQWVIRHVHSLYADNWWFMLIVTYIHKINTDIRECLLILVVFVKKIYSSYQIATCYIILSIENKSVQVVNCNSNNRINLKIISEYLIVNSMEYSILKNL